MTIDLKPQIAHLVIMTENANPDLDRVKRVEFHTDTQNVLAWLTRSEDLARSNYGKALLGKSGTREMHELMGKLEQVKEMRESFAEMLAEAESELIPF